MWRQLEITRNPRRLRTLMNSRHRLVVSAENGAYHAWQCKLFYFSSISRLQHQPVFIVHDNGAPWHPDFYDLIRAGAIVRTVPSYMTSGIPSRNCAGSLLEAASLLDRREIIVLCDPDMVFVARPELPAVLAASYYSYLNYDKPSVYAAARKLDVSKKQLRLRQHELVCGAPYIVPVRLARKIGLTWLEAFDSFTLEHRGDDNFWLDLMYAFGLAIVKLNLPIKMVDAVDVDMPSGCKLSRNIIHYGIGDEDWDKRWYRDEENIARVWNPAFVPAEGTVLAELFSQIRSTPMFYHDSYNFLASSNGNQILRKL